MGAYAPTFMGADSIQFGAPVVPAPPAVSSKFYATELIEAHWCSLLRDVSFSEYHHDSIAKAAAAELSTLPEYQGPKENNVVTPALLFRGHFPGRQLVPISRNFEVTPTVMGASPVDQKYISYKSGIDYMTDETTWFDVQNGISTGFTDQPDPVHR